MTIHEKHGGGVVGVRASAARDREIATSGTVTVRATVSGTSAVVAAAAVAAVVADAIEKTPPAEWPVLLVFAKDLVEEVLELAATGVLDVTEAGDQMLLAVLICGVLQTLSALMSRRP